MNERNLVDDIIIYLAMTVLGMMLFLNGCGVLGESVDKNFTSRTRITYTDGQKTITYDSTKNQKVDFATNADGSVKEVHIQSETPEAAIASQAASLAQSQAANAEIIKAVAPIAGAALQGAIQGGLLGGGPGAAAGAAAGAVKAAATKTGGSNATNSSSAGAAADAPGAR